MIPEREMWEIPGVAFRRGAISPFGLKQGGGINMLPCAVLWE